LSRRAAALAVLALTVPGVAACGGDGDEDEYGDDFSRLSQRIVAVGEDVGEAIENAANSTDAQLADDFDGFAADLGRLRTELDELEPPDDLADEQDELVTAMGEVRESLDDIATAAEQSDPDAARQATMELIQRSEDLRDARRALVRAVREES
jgi:hypothetical protein